VVFRGVSIKQQLVLTTCGVPWCFVVFPWCFLGVQVSLGRKDFGRGVQESLEGKKFSWA
jgi:hypothetical protein